MAINRKGKPQVKLRGLSFFDGVILLNEKPFVNLENIAICKKVIVKGKRVSNI
jgi:hypothetical protein